jgi:AcrR family transcriptional regulator
VPRPRFDNIDPDKKARLLEVAMREFASRGYELASVNRILEDADLSKGSFYYYFDDKADLAATVFIAAAEPLTLLSELRAPASADEFWAELRKMSLERLRVLESKRAQYECVLRLTHALGHVPQLAARVMPLFEPSRRKMAGFLERGVAVGALRSDIPLGTLMSLVEAVKGAAYQAMFPADRVPTEAEMESFTDLVIDLGKRITAPPRE